jgi:hypothetical protein
MSAATSAFLRSGRELLIGCHSRSTKEHPIRRDLPTAPIAAKGKDRRAPLPLNGKLPRRAAPRRTQIPYCLKTPRKIFRSPRFADISKPQGWKNWAKILEKFFRCIIYFLQDFGQFFLCDR